MSMDNEMARDQSDFLHHCYRDHSVTVNPIIDWTDSDVWQFLHHYGCDGNPLYQCGRSRVGCIGCPLATNKQQITDFIRYPKYRANYIRAFQKMLEVREAEGKENYSWTDGESVMRWWTRDDTIDGQLSFFDEDEVLNVLEEMR